MTSRAPFTNFEQTKTRKVNEEPEVNDLLNIEATRLFDREKKSKAKDERSGRKE